MGLPRRNGEDGTAPFGLRLHPMLQILGPYDIGAGSSVQRHVRVYVPKRAQPRDRPLLVMFDGQNVFDDAPSFAGGWHAHVEVERLAKSVPAPVVVGVDHGHQHRMSELSPFPFQRFEAGLPAMLAWITTSLLPDLRARFALSSDPRRVVVAGSSMGGLAALYAAMARADVFGGAIAMSPSLWVGDAALFRWIRERGVPRGSRVYLDGGAREGPRMLAAAQEMAKLLERRADVRFRADPKGHHNERAWRRRLLPALRFHFGTARSVRSFGS